ncbi:MAG: hypothetical protein ACPHQD_17270, partial [Vibrio toranzoniae]
MDSTHKKRFAIVSLHRFETISSRDGLVKIVGIIEKITTLIEVKFILHPPTREALKKHDLYSSLEKNNRL